MQNLVSMYMQTVVDFFTYCKTNNISYWYLYLLTEGEIVIIMDKASTKALLY